MNSDQLRELADRLRDPASPDDDDLFAAADFLRQCAEQQPVAWAWERRYSNGGYSRELVVSEFDARELAKDGGNLSQPDLVYPLYAAPVPQREPLSDEQIANACLSYRHDFGPLLPSIQEATMREAREWVRAFRRSRAMSGLQSLWGQIEDDLGFNDHNMRRDRPYSGQPHTDTGERGRTEIRGITFRDLRDAYIRAVFLSASHLNHAAYEEARKGEGAVLCENDLYSLDWDKLDPVAICQNLGCEVERLMGIFPNVPHSRRRSRAMSDLPPLPVPTSYRIPDAKFEPFYTADQMHAYARAAQAMAY